MYTLFFDVLRCVVGGTSMDWNELKNLSAASWEKLYLMAKRQGVTAIFFDNMQSLPKEMAPPRTLVLKWMSHSMSIEKQAQITYNRCADFAKRMHEHGLNTLVLKGLSVSQYYPNPKHREFGDLDCLLYKDSDFGIVWDDCYEEGNRIAEQAGYVVNRGHYKHSHINYDGLEVENHQFALAIKDGKKTKALERHLRRRVEETNHLGRVGETMLHCPPADFNALFLTAHAMSHFLYESIKIRHVMDWALFLKHEQDNVDWECFWQWCDKMHYTRFVQCVNYICVHQLGLQIHAFNVEENDMIRRLSARILHDIFEGDSLYNKGYSGLRFRLALAASYFRSMWKFHKVYRHSALWLLFKRAMGMLVNDVKL